MNGDEFKERLDALLGPLNQADQDITEKEGELSRLRDARKGILDCIAPDLQAMQRSVPAMVAQGEMRPVLGACIDAFTNDYARFVDPLSATMDTLEASTGELVAVSYMFEAGGAMIRSGMPAQHAGKGDMRMVTVGVLESAAIKHYAEVDMLLAHLARQQYRHRSSDGMANQLVQFQEFHGFYGFNIDIRVAQGHYIKGRISPHSREPITSERHIHIFQPACLETEGPHLRLHVGFLKDGCVYHGDNTIVDNGDGMRLDIGDAAVDKAYGVRGVDSFLEMSLQLKGK